MIEILVDEYCTISCVKILVTPSGKIYSCMLNQTNIEKNNNKFYLIQLLQASPTSYYVYSRYGRVGEKGSISPLKSYDTEYSAINEFQRRFRTKTGNMWTGDLEKFIPKTGKYVLMDTISPELEIIEESPPVTSNIELNEFVTDVISLISSKKLMVKTMQQLDVDTSKLPLGKISKSQMTSAHLILKEIQNLIDADMDNIIAAGILDSKTFVSNQLTKLSSNFWTLIPYSCGRTRPPVIQSKDQLERYIDLLEIMENIKIAGKIFRRTNNINDIYEGINIKIDILEKDEDEWEMIEKYIKNTHASTHNYDLELLNIFSINKSSQDEIDKSDLFKNLSDHRLLIHGSRMANYMGILSEGIRIPKSSQVSNGSVLGLGAYFADSISKAFNYCRPEETDNTGFIILCEVALGSNPHVVTEATFDQRPTAGYTSRIAVGGSSPVKFDSVTLKTSSSDDVLVPHGKLEPSGVKGGFRYNEYVVFDSRQYRFRYLIKLRSNGRVSCW